FELELNSFRWLPGAEKYADQSIFAGGLERNRQYYGEWTTFDDHLSGSLQSLLFDPQTSGGLLIAVPEDVADSLLEVLLEAGESAFLIGRVLAGRGHIHVIRGGASPA